MDNNFDSSKIEKIIHYSFKDKSILKRAFTHSSYAFDKKIESNERLEFLGDAVLNMAVAEELFNNFNVEEGKMTKWRAKMVNSDTLSFIIEDLKLDKYLLIGKSFSNLDISKSMKEDLFECIVGAIYTDSSFEKAKRFIFRFINLQNNIKKKDVDYKSALQEIVQKYKGANLVYFTYEKPRQEGMFVTEVYINDVFVARSESESKKLAQMNCAKLALDDTQKLKEILK